MKSNINGWRFSSCWRQLFSSRATKVKWNQSLQTNPTRASAEVRRRKQFGRLKAPSGTLIAKLCKYVEITSGNRAAQKEFVGLTKRPRNWHDLLALSIEDSRLIRGFCNERESGWVDLKWNLNFKWRKLESTQHKWLRDGYIPTSVKLTRKFRVGELK